jgi:hypothetical protein
MRFWHLLAGAALCSVVLLASPAVSRSAHPPNPNDPCSRAGKDTCGTTGVGFYKVYRYGIRWFGDYRGAIPGEAHTYCIDLGYWYPSTAQKYAEETSPLRNRNGEAVTVSRQQKLAHAIWTYGRTTNPDQAAAVMLYVHGLMGDARPGEVNPAALGPAVVALYTKIARAANLYHGPYRMEITLADKITVGTEATATIRVLSAAGNALPNLDLGLTAEGASGVPAAVRTNANGVATVTLRASDAAGVRLTARTEQLPSTLPKVFAGTTVAARRNGQRLTVPASQIVSASVSSASAKTQLSISSVALPASLIAGQPSRDRVTIGNALPSYNGLVAVRLHGPYRTVGAIRCDETPAWEGSFRANGPGVYTTPPASVSKPGWYVYQDTAPDDAAHTGATTPCTEPSERIRVEVQPRLQTIVSSTRTAKGTALTDRVLVEGLAGEQVTVQAALYGPFSTPEAIRCDGTPVWSGTISAPGDGEYTTEPYTVTIPGYYTYRESIAATEFVRSVETTCADTAETTVVPAQPQVVTQVSSQETRPGGTIHDRVVVTGLGALSAPVRVELWGPYPTRTVITCMGTPYWTGSFVATGNGTYTTADVRLDKAGYYTYRESIATGPATTGVVTECGEATETTFAQATPSVTTLASNEVVRAGSALSDRILVTGLGKTSAALEVELYGPFPLRSKISCTGRPYWSGQVTARGDGEFTSPGVRVARSGFYTFRERLFGSPLVKAFTTPCPLVAETSLAAPKITTGRGEVTRYVPVAGVGGLTPARVQLTAVGLDAPVASVGIDTAINELGVPSNIHRTGWWRDGAAPGSRSGVILIAGHVDSATAGPGAFVSVHRAKPGDRVQVTTENGRTFTYRVVSVRNYPKPQLPTDIYSLRGPPRLVLVTCGGPFDTRIRHYRDNVVLTAVPV